MTIRYPDRIMSRKPRDFDGSHWDTRTLRKVREAGWFRQHEAELIRDARRRRVELLAASEESRRRTGRYRCPKCGRDSASLRSLGGVTVGECAACGWIFVERGDLERLVARLAGSPQPDVESARSVEEGPPSSPEG